MYTTCFNSKHSTFCVLRLFSSFIRSHDKKRLGTLWEILGSLSGVDEECSLPGCDTASIGERFLTFRRIVTPPPSNVMQYKKRELTF